MTLVLYDQSTGEIRARAFDAADTPITDATLTCTLTDSHLHPHVIFVDRAMPYDAGHAYTGPGDLGCYFCTVLDTEIPGPDGLWTAEITAEDSLGNVLVAEALISVQPFILT